MFSYPDAHERHACIMVHHRDGERYNVYGVPCGVKQLEEGFRPITLATLGDLIFETRSQRCTVRTVLVLAYLELAESAKT